MKPQTLLLKLLTPFLRHGLFVLYATIMLMPMTMISIIFMVKTPVASSFLSAMFWAYMLGWIVEICGRVARNLLVVLLAFTAVGSVLIFRTFGVDISPTMFVLLAETNKNETTEFLSMLGTWNIMAWALFTLLASATYFLSSRLLSPIVIRYSSRIPSAAKSIGSLLLTILLLSALTSVSFNTWKTYCTVKSNNSYITEQYDNPAKVIQAVMTTRMMTYDTERIDKNIRAELADKNIIPCSGPDTLDIVMIIGESFVRQHTPLYGYRYDTTPFLRSEHEAGNLVRFDSVFTVDRNTSLSVKAIMTLSAYSEGQRFSDGTFLPLPFKKAGWEVLFLDNQNSKAGLWDFTLNSMIHSDEAEKCYTYSSDKTFPNDDIEFLRQNYSKIADNFNDAPRRLWIYHLMGQHFPYAERFPDTPENRVFTVANYTHISHPWLTDEKRQTIADYDNATLYNDRAIKLILTKHSSRPTVAFYFSDHGEEAYDFRDFRGRDLSGADPDTYFDYHFHIPFVAWFSPSYMQQHPQQVQLLRDNALRRFSTDHIGHLLLDLAGISHPAYNPRHDILSPHYTPSPLPDISTGNN